MKTILHPMTVLPLLVLGVVLHAQEAGKKKAGAMFPAVAAATELTPEQDKQAQKNLDKAVEIYSEILSYNAEGKQASVESNLAFVRKRLQKATDEQTDKRNRLEILTDMVRKQGAAIDAMNVSQELKDRRKVLLVAEFREQKEYLDYRIKTLKGQIVKLREREVSLAQDQEILSQKFPGGTSKKKTWADKDKDRAQNADALIDGLNRTEKDKRATKYK